MDNLKEIIMVTEPEVVKSYKWEKDAQFLHPAVQVLSMEDIERLQEKHTDLFGGKSVYPESVWMKHPFMHNQYIDINTAEDVLTKSKLNALGLIARHLGVKSFTTTFVTTQTEERKHDVNGDVKYKMIEAKTTVNLKKEDSSSNQYYRKEEYSGNFSEESYQEAIKLAKEYGLYNDEDIFYLIQQRNPQHLNMIKNQHVKVELARELNESLDVAFSLDACKVFKLNANYQQTISIKKTVTLETDLVFE